MSNFEPLTLQILDSGGNPLFPEIAIPFQIAMTARQVLEEAYVISQTTDNPDPFAFDLQYYGYSENADYPGYLGYEIESIQALVSDDKYYWNLSVNGVSSVSGADTTYPNPGATVAWQYVSISEAQAEITPRARLIQSRRTTRSKLS